MREAILASLFFSLLTAYINILAHIMAQAIFYGDVQNIGKPKGS